jgi:ABC-type lipoprotein export system ATPase subunit
LKASELTEAVFLQVNNFITTISSFIPEKKFSFLGGELIVHGATPISLIKLSSGEKQLLILLIEALLQKQKPFIFLADEPELSLHISWQRKVISAITKLNPNAQIIVATHSPEIAGKFSSDIIDMEDILHG